jgi:hypothetical protein
VPQHNAVPLNMLCGSKIAVARLIVPNSNGGNVQLSAGIMPVRLK